MAVALSIIVPSHNHGRYIAQTLESCLAQDYAAFEVIVADGASTDGTPAILRDYAQRDARIRWLSEPDQGPADAVNKALRLARGEIAAIQSSDDLYYPGAFTTAMEAFAAQPDLGLVIGDYDGIDETGRKLYTEAIPEFSWEAYLARSMALPQSSIFFRCGEARLIGGWSPHYYSPDIAFWFRLLLRTRVKHVNRVLSAWRIYPGQRTHSPQARRRIWEDYWNMMRDTPELRRASRRVRRLARASAHLLALRFHPTGDRRAVRRHLVLGALQHPTFWRYYPWNVIEWLPAGDHLRRFREWIRRKPVS